MKGYEKDNTIYFVLQVISILIFLFGVINLINTTLSNQLFRRREYSVLRSIGLTEKQLYKVIIGEGMCYSILSICMTLLIGTPIAMLILSSNEYKLLWESGRIFIFRFFLYGYIRIGASVNTGYIIYLSNKRTEEKINY